MNAAIQKFETIAFMRGGRISGFLDRKRASFFITKTLKEVPHIDETGRAVRVAHWIIDLEAPIDVTALLRTNEDDETTIINGDQAARVLEGTLPADNAAEDVPFSSVTGSEFPAASNGVEVELPGASSQGNEPHAAVPRTQRGPAGEAQPTKGEGGNGPSVEQVINAAADFGVDGARYTAYAAKRWGPGWKINATGRRCALAEIEGFRDDPDGFTNKIDTELAVFV
jgi:hypothetical protein